MEETALAREVVTYLTPYLPYLLAAGKIAAAGAAKKFGESAWDNAKTLWNKIRLRAEVKPALQEAVKELVAAPQDVDAQGALRLQLRKLLIEDKSFAEELTSMMSEFNVSNVNVVASGERSVATGGDLIGSTIITGDQKGKTNL
ncbi:MAG TPA: hypothetical protein VF543_22005 [Pyrinomonadaceae bacterium]|jgi:hypothetical protein